MPTAYPRLANINYYSETGEVIKQKAMERPTFVLSVSSYYLTLAILGNGIVCILII